MKRQTLIAATAVTMGLAVAAMAQDSPTRADQIVEYRQAMYTVIGANFSQLGAVVQGKAPYDAQDFAQRADRVAYVAAMLPEGFVAESRTGKPTGAKPGLWTDRAEFDRLLKDMQLKVRTLATTAKSAASVADVKSAFGAAGQACKSCHDKFRKD